MASKLSPSEGDRSASRFRVWITVKKLRPVVFRALFKTVEFLGLVLKIINEAKDLLKG